MSFVGMLETIVRNASAFIYGGIQKSWAWAHSADLLHSESSPIPVISVGAIAIGGSGKTPLTMFLAGKLFQMGFKPVVCSRGYKGYYTGSYELVSDGISDHPLVSSEVCGDEPYLMASHLKGIPVIVGRKRIDAIRAAIRLFDSNVAILDDGFQHLCLRRDLNLVLLGCKTDSMFPSGSLREPFGALERADVVLLDGAPDDLPPEARKHINEKPVFFSWQEPDCITHGLQEVEIQAEFLRGKEVALLSAIANPARFRDMAEQLGWRVVHHDRFDDHQRLSDAELSHVISMAKDLPIVVTEKDWVKTPTWFREMPLTYALRIRVGIGEESAFWKLVLASIGRHESEQQKDTDN